MAQLIKGMFGGGDLGLDPDEARRTFGFSTGNCASPSIIHNGNWFNRAGEFLGWGDLSSEDLDRVPRVLDIDELFIVLYESDHQGFGDVTPTRLADKAVYAADRNTLYFVDHHQERDGEDVIEIRPWLYAKVITREAFAKMLGVAVPARA